MEPLREAQPCRHLEFRLVASNCERAHFRCFEPPSHACLLGSRRKLAQTPTEKDVHLLLLSSSLLARVHQNTTGLGTPTAGVLANGT